MAVCCRVVVGGDRWRRSVWDERRRGVLARFQKRRCWCGNYLLEGGGDLKAIHVDDRLRVFFSARAVLVHTPPFSLYSTLPPPTTGIIHNYAGVGLTEECQALEGVRTGEAKITGAHNLPARHIIHTVGPRWSTTYQTAAENALHSCYRSCLQVSLF